jgi:hypothetical protein
MTPKQMLLRFRALAATRFLVGFSSNTPGAIGAARAFAAERPRDRVSKAIDYATSATHALDEREAAMSSLLASTFDDRVFDAEEMFFADYDLLDNDQTTPAQLATAKLWPESAPSLVTDTWHNLAASLTRSGEHWLVWIRWYDHVVDGLLVGQAWEAAFTDAFGELPWGAGPKSVNDEIAARLKRIEDEASDEQSKTLPAQRPAAVEPVWENGVLTLPKTSATTDLQDQEFAAALRGLSAEILAFADDIADETNIDRRFVSYLRKLADRIPQASPTQEELFRIGHVEAAFESYAKTVNEQWPDFLASQYGALILHFDRTMRQSPSWRAFKRNAAKESLTAEQVASAASLAKATAAALREEEAREFVDESLPRAVEHLAGALDVTDETSGERLPDDVLEAGRELLAVDLIESVNNILKAIVEAALPAAHAGKEYAKGLGKGFVRAAKKQGPKDGEKLFKWLRRVAIGKAIMMAGGAAGLGHLLVKYPEAFTWLRHLLNL